MLLFFPLVTRGVARWDESLPDDEPEEMLSGLSLLVVVARRAELVDEDDEDDDDDDEEIGFSST